MVDFNMATVFETVAGAAGDKECLVVGDQHYTFAEINERANRLASVLHGAGLGCHTERSELEGHQSGQDQVAIYMYNGNEYVESMLAAFKSRTAPLNVNYRYVTEELRYLLNDASAKAIIYHACFAPTLASVLPSLDVPVLIQVADESGNDLLPGAVDYEEALAAADPAGPGLDLSPDDLYLLYTGGTTGMPKGVAWRQHDIFMAAMGGRSLGSWQETQSYEEIAERSAGGGMRMLILPPLMHGAAQWAAFSGFAGGATIVFPREIRGLDPVDVWETVAREKANVMTVVGDAIARPLIEELEKGGYDTSTLLALGNGGAPLNPSLKQRFIDAVPHALVTDAVGSSETGAQMNHLSTAGSVSTGRFMAGPGAVVVDEAISRQLTPGDEEIGWLAQAGWVPLGYLGDAAKTARTFPVIDGVRYSVPGDRARWLADGQIELLGRDAVTINSGGEKIFAEEVEQAITSHPAVHDVVVVGRPSERWGQEVVAIVQLATPATPEELSEHASKSIARYKLPKEYLFLDAIQRSPSGKADYRWAKAQVS